MKRHCTFHVDYLESCRFCRDLNPPEEAEQNSNDREDSADALVDAGVAAAILSAGDTSADAGVDTAGPSMDTPSDIPDAPAAADLGDGFGGGSSDGGGASGDF